MVGWTAYTRALPAGGARWRCPLAVARRCPRFLVQCPIPEQYVHKVVLDKGAPHVSAEVSDLYTH